jgi:hypothetical protein
MAEKRTIELEITDNSKSLKAQLKEAQAEVQKLADTYGATSKQAVEAAKRAADLKDRIGDAKALTDAFNPDAKFKALSGSLAGVAGGFSAITGAMGLMGAESEQVQQLMLKVQSAMALSQGLQALGESRDAFKQLGAVAKNALNGIKSGIAATGIGLLVVALGTLVAYWDDIKSAVSGVTKEQEALIESEKQGAEIAQKKLEAFSLEEKTLKLAGKSEIEINKLRQQRLKTAVIEQEQYIVAMKQKKAMELEAEKRNRKISEQVITFWLNGVLMIPRLAGKIIDTILIPINKGIEALGGTAIPKVSGMIDNLQNTMTKSVAGLLFDPEGMKAEGDKAIDEAEAKLNQLKGQVLDNELAIKNAQEKSAKDTAKTQKETSQDLTAFLDAQEKDRQARITDAKEKELQELANKYDEMTLLADKAGQDTKGITEQYQKDVLSVNEKYRQAELKKIEEANKKAKELEAKRQQEFLNQIEALDEANYQAGLTAHEQELGAIREKYFVMEELAKGNADAEKTIAEAKNREIDAVNKKYADEEAKRKKEAIDRNLDLVKNGLSLVESITELFGKKGEKEARRAFNVKKAAQIASATIDTYKNAVAAYGSQFVPIPDPSSPVRGGIAAGIAVTAGLVNIAKIASQKFEGGGASGGGGGGGGGGDSGGGASPTQAPSFNVVGNNGLNQLAQLQQQPTQAFVVSGDVTSAQSLERNRIQNATL